jgi:DNA-binding NtrC family response regulator
MTIKGKCRLDEMLTAYERLVIMQTLERNRWNRSRAASALGISRRRLQYRMKALHFDLGAIPRDAPGRRLRKAEGA